MFGVADYGAFVIAIIVFLLIPGPGNLALITSTGKGGVRGGLAATLGVMVGDQVLMWLAVAGVAALLTNYPAAFHAVQWLGAAYLGWLGFRMLLARAGAAPVLHIRTGQYGRQADLCLWPRHGSDDAFSGGAHAGQPDDRAGAGKTGRAVPDRFWCQAGDLALSLRAAKSQTSR